MQPEALMLYKLIILYILDKVEFPLTNIQLTNFILDKGYTNYFNIQQVLAELIEDNFIHCNVVRNTSYYEIAETGGETLSFFSDKISDAIKNDIDVFLRDNKYALREANSTRASYYEARKNEYVTSLQILERGNPIIDIHLSLPSEQEANIVCDNWHKKSSDIYSKIVAALMNGES